MMLLDHNRRALDFHYILWRFETSNLDTVTLGKLDNGPGASQDDDLEQDELDSDGNEITPGGGKQVP